MAQIIPVNSREDIIPKYLDTPIGDLVEYHNLGKPFKEYERHRPKLLISMCMDNRMTLNLPKNFAYTLRSGGGNLRHSEFKVSYNIAVGGVRVLALIGHNNCGMANLNSKKQRFIDGLVDVGWDRQAAEDHFLNFSPMFEICNEMDFLISETKRLRSRYPKILVAPLMYQIEDDRLYLLSGDN